MALHSGYVSTTVFFSLCPVRPHILYSYIRLNNIILLYHNKFFSFQPSYNIALLLQKRLYHTPKRSLSHVHTGFLAYRKRLCRMLKKTYRKCYISQNTDIQHIMFTC